MASRTLLGGVLLVVAVALRSFGTVETEEIISRNPVTCISFEDKDCAITATHDVCVYNVGVYPMPLPNGIRSGVFQHPYRLTIPYFWGKTYDELTISLRFSKAEEKNTYILSTGQCGGSSIALSSVRLSRLILKVKTSMGNYRITTRATENQTRGTIHIVVTFYNNPSTNIGRLRIYADGVKLGEKSTQGAIGPLIGPIILGSTGCHYPSQTNVMTFMGDVCFARTELRADEVAAMYPVYDDNCFG